MAWRNLLHLSYSVHYIFWAEEDITEGVAFGDGTTLSVAYDSSNPSVAETLGSAKIATALAIVGIITAWRYLYMVVLRKTKVVQ